MQDTSQLREKRIANLVDALNFKEPEKIPVGMEILMWPFAYNGGTYEEVMGDPEKAAAAYTSFLDDVEVDYLALGPGVSHSVKAHEALGSREYIIARDGVTLQHTQAEGQYMSTDDYDALISDMYGFCSEKWLRMRFPALNQDFDGAYEALVKAAGAFRIHRETNRLIAKNIFEDRQILTMHTAASVRFTSPFNMLFDILRGIPSSLSDLRRRPEIVDAACAVIRELKIPVQTPADVQGAYPLGQTVYHSECFLSPAQFDKYFFTDFRDICLPFMEAGMKFFLKGEGKFLNTIDRYRSLPRGSVLMMLDEDDPFEVYRAIGDWQPIGTGITADLLHFGDKDKCVDYVKRCFDEFAPGGGFVFLQNKPLLCAADSRPDVVRAVYEEANRLSRG